MMSQSGKLSPKRRPNRIQVSQPSAKLAASATQKKQGVLEAPQMAFNDNAEHVRILTSVRKGVEGLRRRMQELQPELSTSVNEATNVARQELCGSLVRRLVIAEKEVQELQDLLGLNQKT
jgi:hypothetical protein